MNTEADEEGADRDEEKEVEEGGGRTDKEEDNAGEVEGPGK